MREEKEIENASNKIDNQANNFSGMTYEQGWDEALMWVLEYSEDIKPPK